MGLTEFKILHDLEKSFKYIRREWRNGRWRYWYDEPNGSVGYRPPVYRQFINNPLGAFKKLFASKRGQALDVAVIKLPPIDMDENGRLFEVVQTDGKQMLIDTPIDLIWGTPKKGLFHLLLRHFVKQNDFNTVCAVENFVVQSLSRLSTNPEEFTIKFEPDKQSYKIVDVNGNSFIVGTEFEIASNGKSVVRHFVMTTFDYRSMGDKQNDAAIQSLRYAEITKQRSY